MFSLSCLCSECSASCVRAPSLRVFLNSPSVVFAAVDGILYAMSDDLHPLTVFASGGVMLTELIPGTCKRVRETRSPHRTLTIWLLDSIIVTGRFYSTVSAKVIASAWKVTVDSVRFSSHLSINYFSRPACIGSSRIAMGTSTTSQRAWSVMDVLAFQGRHILLRLQPVLLENILAHPGSGSPDSKPSRPHRIRPAL